MTTGSTPRSAATEGAEPLFTVSDYERAAEDALDPKVANFLNTGWADGRAMRRNAAAFDDILLLPQRFADASRVRTETVVLGRRVEVPILLAPTGVQAIAHPDGELATAAAARRAGTLMSAGLIATHSVESIVEAAGAVPVWHQIYYTGRARTERFVRRAEAAGCAAVCITVDLPVRTRMRLAQRRDGYSPASLVRLANFAPGESWDLAPVLIDDVEWLCGLTELPIVVKGIMRADDAVHAAEAGAAGIVVSNHGGRESDSTPATIEVLGEIAAAVGERAEVYLDGGIRRGDDVVKALALGARAVMIGRPFWWGLAVGGEEGVYAVLDILRRELVESLVSIGRSDVSSLGPDILYGRGGGNALG
jgi:4-hydroxymandelate oxidase